MKLTILTENASGQKGTIPMHCVDFLPLVEFYNTFGCTKYATGDEIIIE